jgi:PIN domain nuclease of toxin-antitoxin system
MRYYLDTNILVFILSNPKEDITHEVAERIFDYSNMLYASSIAINELILLYKTGKIELSDCKHAIIAQAISGKIPLISSDHKFKNYVSQGLNFVYNKR